MNQRDSDRSAIGGTSSIGQQAGNVVYGAMPEQLVQHLQDDKTGEFLLIRKTRQGDEPQVWSSGDPEQTKALFDEVGKTAFDRAPATT